MLKEKISANVIQRELLNWCRGQGREIIIPNFYIGSYELDVCRIMPSGYVVEYEIKVCPRDLRADFGKCHRTYKYNGGYGSGAYTEEVFKKHECLANGTLRPNRFWFVIPAGLTPLEDIPSHAGVIEFHAGRFNVRRAAPVLHHRKEVDYKDLAESLSFRELRLRGKALHLQHKLQKEREKIEKLKAKKSRRAKA